MKIPIYIPILLLIFGFIVIIALLIISILSIKIKEPSFGGTFFSSS